MELSCRSLSRLVTSSLKRLTTSSLCLTQVSENAECAISVEVSDTAGPDGGHKVKVIGVALDVEGLHSDLGEVGRLVNQREEGRDACDHTHCWAHGM